MVKSRVIAKKQSKKQRTPKSSGAGVAPVETVEQGMERAHEMIARQDFDAAVAVLEGLLMRGEDVSVRELVGVVECERGEVEKGRQVSDTNGTTRRFSAVRIRRVEESAVCD